MSFLSVRPWVFVFSLPLVCSHTAKSQWQLGLEALGEAECNTTTLPAPWEGGQFLQPHTLANTSQDPPDLLSPPDPSGNKQRWSCEVMQLWSFPTQLYSPDGCHI